MLAKCLPRLIFLKEELEYLTYSNGVIWFGLVCNHFSHSSMKRIF